MNQHKTLTDAQLNKLITNRLLSLLHKIRAIESAIGHYDGPRCCEICHEYIGNDWENDVGIHLQPLNEYIERIKKVLATREHVPSQGRSGNKPYSTERSRKRHLLS